VKHLRTLALAVGAALVLGASAYAATSGIASRLAGHSSVVPAPKTVCKGKSCTTVTKNGTIKTVVTKAGTITTKVVRSKSGTVTTSIAVKKGGTVTTTIIVREKNGKIVSKTIVVRRHGKVVSRKVTGPKA
jgi:hypothetical protein